MNKKSDLPPLLSPAEKRVLEYMVKWQGQVVLYHEFWSLGADLESLFVYMNHIRRTGAQIANVRGKGYVYYGGYMEPNKKAKSKPATRPASGPTCKHAGCNKVLMSYEVPRGECFSHTKKRLTAWRNEPIRMTQAA